MPKAGTPQNAPQATKTGPNDPTAGNPGKTPETQSQTPPIESPAPVADPVSEAEKLAKDFQGATTEHFAAPAETGDTPDPRTPDMDNGTALNPRRGPLPTGKVTAFALVRAEDGLWRPVRYTIIGNNVVAARTKEPDLKAILAAQITDCLALDTPLFNDEDGPRE